MNVQTDSYGQSYIDVENVRVTLVVRDDAAWDGPGRYLRTQAYKGAGCSLNPGPELKVTEMNASALALIAAIARLVTTP